MRGLLRDDFNVIVDDFLIFCFFGVFGVIEMIWIDVEGSKFLEFIVLMVCLIEWRYYYIKFYFYFL